MKRENRETIKIVGVAVVVWLLMCAIMGVLA